MVGSGWGSKGNGGARSTSGGAGAEPSSSALSHSGELVRATRYVQLVLRCCAFRLTCSLPLSLPARFADSADLSFFVELTTPRLSSACYLLTHLVSSLLCARYLAGPMAACHLGVYSSHFSAALSSGRLRPSASGTTTVKSAQGLSMVDGICHGGPWSLELVHGPVWSARWCVLLRASPLQQV